MTAELRDSLAQVQELLGCPWCGKVPNIGPWGAQDLNAWPDATAIECSSDLHDCPINPSVTGYTRAEAITAWNTRHGDADRSAELTTAWMAGVESVLERAAEAWRPIDTLVRDGRRVLTWHDAGTVVANPQHFAYGHRGWVSTQAAVKGLLATEYCETGKVTHWRPLPAPPTDDAARAGERGAL